MEEETLRKIAIRQHLQGKPPISIYCEMGRCKKWFFKWLHRYQPGDAEWYQDRPKTPHTHPHQTSPDMRNLVSNIRIQLEENPYAQVGTAAIKREFKKLGVISPSDRTINRILKKEGLAKKNSLYARRSGISLFHKASKSHLLLESGLLRQDVEAVELWLKSKLLPCAFSTRGRVVLSLTKGLSVSKTARYLGVSRNYVYRWANRYMTYGAKWYLDKSHRPHSSPFQTPKPFEDLIVLVSKNLHKLGLASGARSVSRELNNLHLENVPSISTIHCMLERYGLIQKNFLFKRADEISSEKTPLIRKDHRTHGGYSFKGGGTIRLTLTETDKDALEGLFRSTMTPAGLAKRSHIILTLAEGRTPSETAVLANVSRRIVYKWAHRFIKSGIDGLNRARQHIIRKADNDSVKSTIFSILHSPPSEYGINRTSWKFDDLKKCLFAKGIFVSKGVISRVIRSAGFNWRRARIVLTSPDPEYRQKLTEIQSILARISPEERFFSIDEFGPFAIKRRGGRKLVPPGEYPYVAQCQVSKGSLIITAALELSHNRITHFYSPNKNTKEMIKLLELLLVEYKSCKRIFLSWDAAAWHISKALYRRVDEINTNEYQQKHETPKVVLAPLPKSAQFLNVIESVFSGMARAILHNSDYESKEAAIKAIDRYFGERNAFFEKNPCRAGKKIWGQEIVPAEFSESQNCKDPKWCRN